MPTASPRRRGNSSCARRRPACASGCGTRFAGHARIAVIGADDLAAEADGSFDIVVMHSVSQYLTPAELDVTLAKFRRLLAADGHLVIGDVLQPQTPAPGTDALALLRFGAGEGFFLRRGLRPRADAVFQLLVVAFGARPHPLCRSRDDRPSRRRRLRRAAPARTISATTRPG